MAAAATPRLPIDPAAFSDDSLALPPPRLDYDPTILGMACSPADASCLGAEPAANLTGLTTSQAGLDTPGTGTQVLALSPSGNDEAQDGIFAVERAKPACSA
ncbi:MAG: hypothetical protein IPO97_00490 [Sphingomonadales bacterium]|nr:hypothetical protein [Sphingomonadales bacterium]